MVNIRYLKLFPKNNWEKGCRGYEDWKGAEIDSYRKTRQTESLLEELCAYKF